MARTSRARHLRHRRFGRTSRSKRFRAWLSRESTRLTPTATPDTFVTVAQQATGVLTLTGNLTGDVAATGVLTLTGNALDTETVTIGSTVYTFQTTLVDSANNVLVGASASDSIDNLIAAITAGAGAGTVYGTGTLQNGEVTAAAGVGDTMDVTALNRGVNGNGTATTETLTNGSFGGATLSGGVEGDQIVLGSETYTLNAATLVDSPFNVLLGATTDDTINNLVDAINGSAGEGTTYGTGTTANDLASAVGDTGADTITATALNAGDNTIASEETATNASWGAATLTGGVASNDLTAVAHGFSQGEGPYRVTTSGALPQGLVADTDYFVNVVDNDTFQLEFQGPGGPVLAIQDEGSGTHTITKDASSEGVFELLKSHRPRTIQTATDVDDLN